MSLKHVQPPGLRVAGRHADQHCADCRYVYVLPRRSDDTGGECVLWAVNVRGDFVCLDWSAHNDVDKEMADK